jgi:hypothetical protein
LDGDCQQRRHLLRVGQLVDAVGRSAHEHKADTRAALEGGAPDPLMMRLEKRPILRFRGLLIQRFLVPAALFPARPFPFPSARHVPGFRLWIDSFQRFQTSGTRVVIDIEEDLI